MLIDTAEYIEHLKLSLPDFNFTGLEKIEDYKQDSEIYEVNFDTEAKGRKIDLSYRMLVGHPDMEFSKEEQLANFVKVAELTYSNKVKEEKAEAEAKEKEAEKK